MGDYVTGLLFWLFMWCQFKEIFILNHNVQQNKKKVECGSSTTCWTLGQLWRVMNKKKTSNSLDCPKAFGQQSVNGWKQKDKLKKEDEGGLTACLDLAESLSHRL